MEQSTSLYLDLMKRCLTNWIYADCEIEAFAAESDFDKKMLTMYYARGLRVVRPRKFDPKVRADGRDWPPTAHSMIGLKRLENLQRCIETIVNDKVEGDVIETGVWRGGASIFMRAALKALEGSKRTVWVADSFQGLPRPDAESYPQDTGLDFSGIDELAIPLEQVQSNFRAYGLLDDNVKFLKGWFRDTLPDAPMESLSLIRLDGDLYESTIVALESLYPKLSVGGFVIADDYGALDACKNAVEDYRAKMGISEPITTIDWSGSYWRKLK